MAFASLLLLQPELVLICGFLLIIILDFFIKESQKQNTYLGIMLCSIIGGMYSLYLQGGILKIYPDAIDMFYGQLALNSSVVHVKFWIYVAALLFWVHWVFIEDSTRGFQASEPEFAGVFLFLVAALGLTIMCTSMVSLFVCLEVVSITTYAMVALPRKKPILDAAFDYLIFGGMTSAFTLFGMALLYGVTGTMGVFTPATGEILAAQDPAVAYLIVFFILSGLFFKLAAVPFHLWVPSVYENGPTPLISFLSVAPKLAAIYVLLRFQVSVGLVAQKTILAVALASVLIGNLTALRQNHLLRLMAFSTVAHAGFILLGAALPTKLGLDATFFYAETYVLIGMGAFFVIDVLKQNLQTFDMPSFAGFGRSSKILGLTVVVFMVALVGLPPTVGFTAKFLVFSNQWALFSQSGQKIWLVALIIGLLNAVISLFAYLKLPYFMYLKPQKTLGFVFKKAWVVASIWALAIIILFFKPELIT